MINQTSVLYKHNYYAAAPVVINQGGTSSGKTYAIMQVLFSLAVEQAEQIITVVGQDVPNLKAGVIRDAHQICQHSEALRHMVKSYKKTDRIFEFINGSAIEFRSFLDAQGAKAGKRDYLFVNEANGVEWDVYSELALRTKKRVYIDYNPTTEFWAHEQLIGKPDVLLLISDHRHNPFIDEALHQRIEALKQEDLERWKVYARGLTGKITGLIFNNWYLCEAIPPDAKLLAAGLDFGFTNDQTGCLLVFKQNGELWVNEILYETQLTNKDISRKLKEAGISKNTEIIADSAEPKSIEELKRMGWYITGAKKGADSIINSIDILKRYKINVTRGSVNLRKELAMYQWRTDKTGRAINQPVDARNHLIDPLRYVALNKLKLHKAKGIKSMLPRDASPVPGGMFEELTGLA